MGRLMHTSWCCYVDQSGKGYVWVLLEDGKVLAKYRQGTRREKWGSRPPCPRESAMVITVRWVKFNCFYRVPWISWVSAVMKKWPSTSSRGLWCIMGTWNSSKSKGKSRQSQMARKVPLPVTNCQNRCHQLLWCRDHGFPSFNLFDRGESIRGNTWHTAWGLSWLSTFVVMWFLPIPFFTDWWLASICHLI